jgi:hypothetical protein
VPVRTRCAAQVSSRHEKLWFEEALTAVVMPRHHVDNSVKRARRAKLEALKDRAA